MGGAGELRLKLRALTDYSSWGPGFNSQTTHGSSQLSVTPVPGNPTPCSGFVNTRYIHVYTDMHPLKASIHME